eukprot:scaffold73972_cov67-Phaeocystis_antarctica.AAC.2
MSRGAQLLELVELNQAALVLVVLGEQRCRLRRGLLQPDSLQRAAQRLVVELAAVVGVVLVEGVPLCIARWRRRGDRSEGGAAQRELLACLRRGGVGAALRRCERKHVPVVMVRVRVRARASVSVRDRVKVRPNPNPDANLSPGPNKRWTRTASQEPPRWPRCLLGAPRSPPPSRP